MAVRGQRGRCAKPATRGREARGLRRTASYSRHACRRTSIWPGQRLADLFVDTLPYNAHTTASDALWAGLPLITVRGTTFAGRVAASLLHAAGVPELVTGSLGEYEALALELATHHDRLAAIRARLIANRDRCALFDADRFRRHIEWAYEAMWQRFAHGEPPAAFDVAALDGAREGKMKTDIEIAQACTLAPIPRRATAWNTRRSARALRPSQGEDLARLAGDERGAAGGKLVPVSAISPTPAGEGKTTTTVGLTDALNRIGDRAIACLREPSLGPVFGMKGGAAGGGYAQVVPMEDINLHFTGDFHAIAVAHNLLAALIDNHIHHGNALGIDVRRIVWKRVIDMNDRALREMTVGLGGPGNGFPRQDGFDIVAASEVMAIFCLARTCADLRRRLGNIVVRTRATRARACERSGRAGRDGRSARRRACKPNLVQTLEDNPALIHGGPFGNIAHGCNSVIATEAARQARGRRHDRGRVRRRPGRGEVHRHQVPEVRVAARHRRAGRDRARAQVSRWRCRRPTLRRRTCRRWKRGSRTSSGT